MMNHPEGARILWPPLFDHLIATVSVAVGRKNSPESLKAVAALVPPVLGVLTLLLVAAIGRLLVGPGAGIVAALVVALLPAHVYYGEVGRPDHHIAETFFFCWILLAFLAGWLKKVGTEKSCWLSKIFLGFGITLAFWNWMGSGLYLVFLLTVTSLWHLLAPNNDSKPQRAAKVLAWGATLSTVLLAVSIILGAPPGQLTKMSLSGLTGFHVTLLALTATFGWVLTIVGRPSSRQSVVLRILQIAASAGIPFAVALVVLPGFRQGIFHGLTFLGRANPWYPLISEMQPVFFSGIAPLHNELTLAMRFYGLGLYCMPLILIPLVLRWRNRPEERQAIFFLFLWGGWFLLLALMRRRFDVYFAVPLGLWLALGWSTVFDTLLKRWGRRTIAYVASFGILILILLPAVPTLVEKVHPKPHMLGELFTTLNWLGDEQPRPGHEGVLSGWEYGHYIRYFARKPVVVDPFGTELGYGAMEDAAVFFLAREPKEAEKMLLQRRVGFVLLRNPLLDTIAFSGFVTFDKEPPIKTTYSWYYGRTAQINQTFWELVTSRLYFFNGLLTNRGKALEGYRLLYESPSDWRFSGLTSKRYKVFGVVPGAKIIVQSEPGSTIIADIRLRTNQGRKFTWRTSRLTDKDGHTTLRLPYATETARTALVKGIKSNCSP
jgi:dolichyl-diphosphooligosaccharide--protein glycosyltransferase